MSEKYKEPEFEYQKSKWGKDIDTALYWLEKDNGPKDEEYLKLEAWTAWMIQLGHKEDDDVVRKYTQVLMPYVTDELWKDWIKTVNSTSAQK